MENKKFYIGMTIAWFILTAFDIILCRARSTIWSIDAIISVGVFGYFAIKLGIHLK